MFTKALVIKVTDYKPISHVCLVTQVKRLFDRKIISIANEIQSKLSRKLYYVYNFSLRNLLLTLREHKSPCLKPHMSTLLMIDAL